MKNMLMIAFAIGLFGNAFNGYASADPRRGGRFMPLPTIAEDQDELSLGVSGLTLSQALAQGNLANKNNEMSCALERAQEDPSRLIAVIDSMEKTLGRYREAFSGDGARSQRAGVYQRVFIRLNLIKTLVTIDENFENSPDNSPDLTAAQINALFSSLEGLGKDQEFLELVPSGEAKTAFVQSVSSLLEFYEIRFPISLEN